MATAPKLAIVQSRLEPTDILTPKELSKRLKVPLSWIYEKSRERGIHGRALPVLRCGRYLRFDWNAVSEWLRRGDL
jgi:excisionase family DNA binding protein